MKPGLDFRNDPVQSLIYRLALPSFIGIVINFLYGFIDGVFIGKGVGVEALGGVTVIFPLTIIVISFASLIGEGLASVTARSIATGQRDYAVRAIQTGQAASLVLSGLIVLGSGVRIDGLLHLLGAVEEIASYARIYYVSMFPGLPFMALSLVYFHQLNAQGGAKVAMKAMALSTAINIVLDYFSIYILELGVAGAAYATVISQIVWFSYMHFHAMRDQNLLTVKFPLAPGVDLAVLREMTLLGMGSFIRQTGVSLALILINSTASQYGTAIHIAAFGATQRILRLAIAPISAVGLAFKPIAGQNFGFKAYDRVKEALRTAMIATFGLGCFLLASIILFGRPLGILFGLGNDALDTYYEILLYTTGLFPLYGVHQISVAYFTALGKARQAVALNLVKQVLVLIPLVLVLPNYFGVMGLFAALPLSDAVSIVVSFVLLKWDMNRLEKV